MLTSGDRPITARTQRADLPRLFATELYACILLKPRFCMALRTFIISGRTKSAANSAVFTRWLHFGSILPIPRGQRSSRRAGGSGRYAEHRRNGWTLAGRAEAQGKSGRDSYQPHPTIKNDNPERGETEETEQQQTAKKGGDTHHSTPQSLRRVTHTNAASVAASGRPKLMKSRLMSGPRRLEEEQRPA